MASTAIWQNIRGSIYLRGQSTAFITDQKISEIWAGDRLQQFANNRQLGLTQAELSIAKNELLRILSTLVWIGWPDWSRFKAIFFPPEMEIANYRRDINISEFGINELEEESFLGTNAWANHFIREKWTFCPVVLKPHEDKPYTRDHRLPLVPVDSEKPREGGYGKITKVEIPAGHISIQSDDEPTATNPTKRIVARKTFRQGRYAIEKRILTSLQNTVLVHRRIVPYLAIFFVENELNIIFPWADMDLEDFLRGRYREMESPPSLFDIIAESTKLASAIKYLHEHFQPENESDDPRPKSICHLDLKPMNILVFKHPNWVSTGMWKITDFGISRIVHEVVPEMNGGASAIDRLGGERWASTIIAPPPQCGSYQSPDSIAHPKNDIWSFGCILVRLFSFGFDPTGLEEFDRRRIMATDEHGSYNHDFFLRRNPLRLNHQVESWIADLPSKSTNAASYDKNFLEEMSKLLRSMLVINIDDRLSATQVHDKLNGLHCRRTSIGSISTMRTDSTTRANSSSAPSSLEVDASVASLPPLDLLVTAIKSGGAALVRTSLGNRRDLDNDIENKRPLAHAIERGDASILEVLLAHMPRPDLECLSSSDENAETPLHLAISKRNVDIVELLLKADVKVNTRSPRGVTPLMHAAERGHADIISELLKSNADATIFHEEHRMWNCLHYAVNNTHCGVEVIKAFHKERMVFDLMPPNWESKEFVTPLRLHVLENFRHCYTTNQKNIWIAKFDALIAGGADIDRKLILNPSCPSKSILETVLENDTPNNLSLARLLVNSGAKLSRDYVHPMRYPSNGMVHVVKKAKPQEHSRFDFLRRVTGRLPCTP